MVRTNQWFDVNNSSIIHTIIVVQCQYVFIYYYNVLLHAAWHTHTSLPLSQTGYGSRPFPACVTNIFCRQSQLFSKTNLLHLSPGKTIYLSFIDQGGRRLLAMNFLLQFRLISLLKKRRRKKKGKKFHHEKVKFVDFTFESSQF